MNELKLKNEVLSHFIMPTLKKETGCRLIIWINKHKLSQHHFIPQLIPHRPNSFVLTLGSTYQVQLNGTILEIYEFDLGQKKLKFEKDLAKPGISWSCISNGIISFFCGIASVPQKYPYFWAGVTYSGLYHGFKYYNNHTRTATTDLSLSILGPISLVSVLGIVHEIGTFYFRKSFSTQRVAAFIGFLVAAVQF